MPSRSTTSGQLPREIGGVVIIAALDDPARVVEAADRRASDAISLVRRRTTAKHSRVRPRHLPFQRVAGFTHLLGYEGESGVGRERIAAGDECVQHVRVVEDQPAPRSSHRNSDAINATTRGP